MFQERVYMEKVRTVEELQQHITEDWKHLDQRVIDNAVKQWRKRLRARVAAYGAHSEHLLWMSYSYAVNAEFLSH